MSILIIIFNKIKFFDYLKSFITIFLFNFFIHKKILYCLFHFKIMIFSNLLFFLVVIQELLNLIYF
jgi:hypothetical protein